MTANTEKSSRVLNKESSLYLIHKDSEEEPYDSKKGQQ